MVSQTGPCIKNETKRNLGNAPVLHVKFSLNLTQISPCVKMWQKHEFSVNIGVLHRKWSKSCTSQDSFDTHDFFFAKC
jgi:hypothetical protein